MAGGSNLTMCYSSVDALRSDSEDQEHLPGRVTLKDEWVFGSILSGICGYSGFNNPGSRNKWMVAGKFGKLRE